MFQFLAMVQMQSEWVIISRGTVEFIFLSDENQ